MEEKKKKILVADDNSLNRFTTKSILEKNGFLVECVQNGKEVITAFTCSDEGEFSAILMDTTMPIYDGINATKIIRGSSQSDAESIPIIAVTLTDSELERENAAFAGMNDYLVKPFAAEALMSILSKYIK